MIELKEYGFLNQTNQSLMVDSAKLSYGLSLKW